MHETKAYLATKIESTTLSTSRVGERDIAVIPAALYRRLRSEEGLLVIVEDRVGVAHQLRRSGAPRRLRRGEGRSTFLLSNAVNSEDCVRTKEEVRKIGPDPATITYRKP